MHARGDRSGSPTRGGNKGRGWGGAAKWFRRSSGRNRSSGQMSCGFLALPVQRTAAGWSAVGERWGREGMAKSIATAV